jgi:hypothetical protein
MKQQEFKEQIQQFQRGDLPAEDLRMLLDQRGTSTEIRKEIELILKLDEIFRKALKQFAHSMDTRVQRKLEEGFVAAVDKVQPINSRKAEPKILTEIEIEKLTIDFHDSIRNLPVSEGAAERLLARLKRAYTAEGLDPAKQISDDGGEEVIKFQQEDWSLSSNERDVSVPMEMSPQQRTTSELSEQEFHPRGKVNPLSPLFSCNRNRKGCLGGHQGGQTRVEWTEFSRK